MKYIIFEAETGLRYPVIFSIIIKHSTMSNKIKDKTISAGFCKIFNGKIQCYGQSVSLNLHCNIGDADLLNIDLIDI